ncbi:hypothetical protein DYB37_013645 [Aphanomyces astaci]|uniref:Peptidase S1 domain-containing protein n=2 Tax=Aphanomyces astaci TaxID=112090 RepID=A0A418CSS6_APHAT|nr:hypothetical protein DYB35_010147 [Aphanomyces astaci]RHZ06912.1 hypothetical protein DYB37_013645 [Aphanomyces astaci]
MKFALLFALTVAVAALAQDQIVPAKVAWGDEVLDDGFEIVGGQEAQFGKHLYVTGVKAEFVNETVCGGSLIAPNIVLTAAHCLSYPLVSVVVGTHYLTGFADGEQATIIQKFKHPKRSVDLGILILDHDISITQPVAVSFDFVEADVLTWIRGWGRVKEGGPQSQMLKEVSLKTWTNTRTSAALLPVPVIDTMLGAGGVEGEDTCIGDSGGPLTIEENGAVRLVGVASWGIKCGALDIPGIYARVSAARDFIKPYLPK